MGACIRRSTTAASPIAGLPATFRMSPSLWFYATFLVLSTGLHISTLMYARLMDRRAVSRCVQYSRRLFRINTKIRCRLAPSLLR
ncbi:hypothetical protein BDZ89DRAFT_1072681 [Hymenopellis radicata]|nr:hypothetical protein BDZ89DRAFT_1072681 [Hymenopellis radicata]